MHTLRSLAANSLTARQKSTIRSLAFRLGQYRRRPVEVVVDDLVRFDGARTFLQIGANDGYLSDPLNLAIYPQRLSGTFVEPQANYFHAASRPRHAGGGRRRVDHLILSQFDFAGLATKLVIYETESMDPRHAAELAAKFEACGFGLIEAGQDTVALRRDTATFRKHAAKPN